MTDLRGGAAIDRLGAVPSFAVILVTTVTVLGVLYGPRPMIPLADDDLSSVGDILVEPTDRLVLIAWFAITVVLLTWSLRRDRTSDQSAVGSIAAAVIGAGAVFFALLSIVLDVDQYGGRPNPAPVDFVVGGGVVALGLYTATRRSRSRALLSVALIVAALAVMLPELWQSDHGLRDWDSSRFSMDEVAAPAIGRVPYGDYAPQYTALLGLPIAPLLNVVPASALTVVVGWLILLQVVTLGLGVMLPLLAVGRRFAALTVIVVLAVPIAVTPYGTGSTTYFAAIPLRMFLPLAALVLAFVVLRRPAGRWLSVRGVVLGAAVGAAAVNNPEFGIPVLAAGLIVVAFLKEPRGDRLRRGLGIVTGTALVAAVYGLWAWLAGAPISTDFLFVFQRLFGAKGFFNWAMPAVGLHVAVVSLFVSATVIGLVLIRRRGVHTWLGRQGLLLALVGTWSVLSVGYYVGRSLTATLIGGFALQIGILAAGLAPLAWALWRSGLAFGHTALSLANVALALIALVWCAGNVTRLWAPWTYFTDDRPSSAALRFDTQVADLARLPAPSGTTQLLTLPAMTALMSGVGSEPVVSGPDYLTLSRSIARLQCAQWRSGTAQRVLLTRETVAGLVRSPECRTALDLESPARVPEAPDWVIVPIRRPVG